MLMGDVGVRLLALIIIDIYAFCQCAISPHVSQPAETAETKPYEGFSVFQITALNSSQFALLETLHDEDGKNQLDFWTAPSDLGKPSEVMVPPDRKDAFQFLLSSAGMKYNVTIPNVQKLLDEEEQLRSFRRSLRRDDASSLGADGQFRLDQFHSYIDIERFMRNLASQFPDLIEPFAMPYKTHEGRIIRGVKLGLRANQWQRNRPVFWIDGGAHAREWISPAVSVYIIDQLVRSYSTDASVKKYLDRIDFYIIPVLNPDGYEYSRRRLRLWRKNRNPNGDHFFGLTDHCNGVDLNRNFGFAWGGKGSSGDRCSSTYRGGTPFSEPESRGLRDTLTGFGHRLKGYLSLHSYAQLWAYPYGHDKLQPTEDHDTIRVARNVVRAVRRTYGTNYIADTSGNYLYPAAGAAADWVKSNLDVPYAYLIELPPKKNSYVVGFTIDEAKIVNSGHELFRGVGVIAEEISRKRR